MKIMVSACLLGHNCKYNGGNNFNQKLADFLQGHEVVPVCPERLSGLPTPRAPSEIVNGVVMNAQGVNVDKEFRRGAELAFEQVQKIQPDMIILQSRSPSCGVNQIYDGSFSKKLIPGQGLFAAKCIDGGFKTVDLEDI